MKGPIAVVLSMTMIPGGLCVSMMWIDVAQKAGSLKQGSKAKRAAQKRRLQLGIGIASVVLSLFLGILMISGNVVLGAAFT